MLGISVRTIQYRLQEYAITMKRVSTPAIPVKSAT
jgi:hypothetical protein